MLELKNVSKSFNKGKENETKALNNVSLSLDKGDWLMVMGSNGSGKSSLLNSIAGLIDIDSGSISIDGVELNGMETFKRSKFISRMFQNPTLGTASELSILENFRIASLHTHPKNISIGINKSFENRVKESVKILDLGLENKLNQPMGSLSGGQRQALTLLMTAMDPVPLLLMDEPTAALDPKTAELILKITKNLVSELKLTVIFITHQFKEGLFFGNKICYMENGGIKYLLEGERKGQLTIEQLSKWFV